MLATNPMSECKDFESKSTLMTEQAPGMFQAETTKEFPAIGDV